MKLVHVTRTDPILHYDEASGFEIEVIPNKGWNEHQVMRTAEIFLVGEQLLEPFVSNLCRDNPGIEVQVYQMEWAAICPAGPMVKKQVSVDGTLPI